MANAGLSELRRQKAFFALAAALLLAGLLALLLLTGGIPTAHADGPVLTVSSSTTNPGGDVMVSGTGWSPARHYNLYVYGQAKCRPNPICPPPSTSKPINSSPQPINSDGSFSGFDFSFIANAAATTYVFTVVADYPTTNPYTQSVLVQVVPAGTPPSGTPVSSSPTAVTPTTTATTAASSPTATSQGGGATGNQTTTPTSSSGSNTLAIIVVTVLLLIGIAVLTGLLIVLPPKRRAIRAAWYGTGNAGSSGSTGGRRYGASSPGYGASGPGYGSGPVYGSGPAGSGPRRSAGGYPPANEPEQPGWMGGVGQWDNPQRPPRGSGPRAPRRPSGSG